MVETNRSRGHRRLDVRTYQSKCLSCIWDCRMSVERITDQLEPVKEKVPVRDIFLRPEKLFVLPGWANSSGAWAKRHVLYEADWVDQDASSHRRPDN